MLKIALQNPSVSALDRARAMVSQAEVSSARGGDSSIVVDDHEIFVALRLMIANGEISHNDVAFSFNGENMTVTETGSVVNYPFNLFNEMQQMLAKLARIRRSE